MIRAFPLLGLDLQNDELGQSELNLLISDRECKLTGEHTPRELRKVERGRVPASATVELRRNRSGHGLSMSRLGLSRPCQDGRLGRSLGGRFRGCGSRLTGRERLRYDVAPAGPVPGHLLRKDQVLAVETTARRVPLANTVP